MANSLTNVVPQILAQGLKVLRENAIMPRLVNRSFGDEAKEFGDTIDIPFVGLATAVTVSPGPTFATNVDTTVSKVSILLDFWRQTSFVLSDKEIEEAISGVLPLRAQATIKGLANAVDSFILGKFTGIFSFGGVAGTTPFNATLGEFRDARKELNKQLAPLDGRVVVLDPDAEANALVLSQFLKADERGDQGGIINGEIGRKLGANWFLNQNIPTHSAGSGTAEATVIMSGAAVTGASEIAIKLQTSNTGTLLAGDLFTIDAKAQQYVVAATVTYGTTAGFTITINPSLAVSHASGVLVTYVTSHVVNLLFAREAFAFASRPLERSKIEGLGSIFETVVDPISGLALRLEVSRQNKQTSWVWDILGGAALVRPELAARILG